MLEKVKICKDNGVDAINIPDGPRASTRISSMVAAILIKEKINNYISLHYILMFYPDRDNICNNK